ncbi:zinc finger protein 135-like [Candoia aspera]|uniref:zinc finger protein 135-like n=1 Tax=Candoia aspera TaxID=51853 RepID=UPI002FD833CB
MCFCSHRGMIAKLLTQGLLAFEEVAVCFTEEEWVLLDLGQRALYQEVMAENYRIVASLVQELQPGGVNAEGREAGAAHRPEQKMEREGKSHPISLLPTERGLTPGAAWPKGAQGPFTGPKQESRCFLHSFRMAFSPPSLEFSMREFQRFWKAVAGGEDALQTWIHFGGETAPSFANAVKVKEELVPEEESPCMETPGRLEEKVRRPLADINSSTPMQESLGRVKIQHWMETTQEGDFLGKTYQGPSLGTGSSALELEDGFWLERPKEINPHGMLLERARGKLIQGPDVEESLEIKQETDSLPESKSDLALFCEEVSMNGPVKAFHGRDVSSELSIADCSKNQKAPVEGEQTYKCCYCGRCFAESLDLVAHERAHIGEKIYRCSHCEKHFAHRIDLLTHKRNHQGEKPHQCKLDCAKCHRQRTFPRIPHRAPSGEQACQCPVCGEHFSWKSNLIRHRRIHTGEKPYRCAECGKSYTRKTALDRHKRTHVGEKPCEISAPSMGQASVLVLLV